MIPEQCKILFVTYGGGHARMLAPVVEQLSKNQDFDISVLALTTAVFEFDSKDITVYGYKDFFSDALEVKRYGDPLARELDMVADYQESVAYLGQNYLELAETLGEKQARKIFEKSGRQAFTPINSMKTILEQLNPDLVVTTNAPRSEKAAVEAARILGIKSIALIDMFSIRCESWFSSDNFADKVLVLSESVKNHLVSKGRSSSSIVVTGNPAFDSLVKYYDQNKKQIEDKRSGLPFTVLWASQREPEYNQEINSYGDPGLPTEVELALLGIFEKHPEWQLIARNHPSEEQREYPGFVAVSTQSESLPELLSGVHVVISLTSTVGFQGAILGASFITLDCSVLTPTMPFSKMGFSTGIQNISELEDALINLYENIPGNKASSLYEIDNATEKIVREITAMIY